MFVHIETDYLSNGDMLVNFIDSKLIDDDNVHIPTIGEELYSLIGNEKIIVSFSGVETMDSSMLGRLASLQRKINTHGHKLVLCEVSKRLREHFQITKLDKFLTIVETKELAER